MEKWQKVYEGIIPAGNYSVNLQNGETDGLIITLSSMSHDVKIDFGVVSAIRMLDEGLVQCELYDDTQIQEQRKENFNNTIYRIEGGEFGDFARKIGGELYEGFGYKHLHYIIITMNYVIEVITEWEPNIYVTAD